jgi:outer membrane biosynthesis protein TonB
MEHCGFMTTAALSYRSRALSAAAVALPVPLLAALGLSLPLPATVARLAARLVPFAESGGQASAISVGEIVARPGEAEVVRVRVRDASGHTRVISVPRTSLAKRELVTAGGRLVIVGRESRAAAAAEAPVAEIARQQSSDNAPAPADAPVAAAPAPTPAPTPQAAPPAEPTPAPSPAPTPTEQVVNTVTTAVDNTVSNVSNTVNTVTTASNTVNNTVTTVTGTAQHTVGGLLGGKP